MSEDAIFFYIILPIVLLACFGELVEDILVALSDWLAEEMSLSERAGKVLLFLINLAIGAGIIFLIAAIGGGAAQALPCGDGGCE